MAILKIKISDKIIDKVLWLFQQFKDEELQILESDISFSENKKYVEEELRRLESGESKSYSIEEFDAILEESIRKYES